MENKLYDIGKTDAEALYVLAISLSCAAASVIDPKSELYKAVDLVCRSAWAQLPSVFVVDMREPEEVERVPAWQFVRDSQS